MFFKKNISRITKIQKGSGQALVELILAVGVVVIVMSAVIESFVTATQSYQDASLFDQAEDVFQGQIEALRSIHEKGWDQLPLGSNYYAQVEESFWTWTLTSGPEADCQFCRDIDVSYACRNNFGDLVGCSESGAIEDRSTKKIIVTVSWVVPRPKSISQTLYFVRAENLTWVETTYNDFIDGTEVDVEVLGVENPEDSVSGLVQLEQSGGPSAEVSYDWNFSSPLDYVFDPVKIEVIGGVARLREAEILYSGDTLNPHFNDGTSGWTFHLWDQDFGEVEPNGKWDKSKGNPKPSINIDFPDGKGDGVGGYWMQAFTTTVNSPSIATINLDTIVSKYEPTPITFKFYVFIDSTPGEPSIGSEVWSKAITGVTGWEQVHNLDASFRVGGAGTYYLKIAAWMVTPGGAKKIGGTVDFDNVNLHWEGSTTGYPTDQPSIYPTNSFTPTYQIASWSFFAETATKNGGEIYYQISDNDGATWQYWNGTTWTVAGANDFNIASEVNNNIRSFPTVNNKIRFRAFLKSDGTQLVLLDNVHVEAEYVNMEVDQVSTDENWVTVNLQNTYNSPVIITQLIESNNTLPASTRIQNVQTGSFEIKLQNPSGADLQQEVINYLVIEEGAFYLQNVKIEAHKYQTSTVGSKNGGWNADPKTYTHTYTSNPFVLHQVMSNNDPAWISTWVSSLITKNQPPDTSDFQIALNGAEATTSHGEETIGYVVIEQDKVSAVGNVSFETQYTPRAIQGHDNGCYNFNFNGSYSDVPLTFSSQQTMNGSDGGWLLVCSQSLIDVGFHVEQDQVLDEERQHPRETGAFITFSETFSISGEGISYATSGTYESSTFTPGGVVGFHYLSWSESGAGEIQFQIAVEDPTPTCVDVVTWNFVGPDGEVGSFYTEPAAIPLSKSSGQCFKYKTYLSGDGSLTPILEDVTLNYSP